MIDAHMHFWDPARWHYPWLDDVVPLRRRFVPADLDPSGPLPDAVVFVEAGGGNGDPFAEVSWAEQLAGPPVVAGIVAQVALELGAAARPAVRRLADRPLVKGVRRNLQDEADGFALGQGFRAGVRLLAEHGLVADLCVRDRQLAEVTELVRATPEVSFVLDHVGKPGIRTGRWQPWADDLARLAERPNVTVKLSGLATEADWSAWTAEQIAAYLEHALAVFGAERCMFGSDWPVSTLATSYADWYATVAGVLAGRSSADRALVLGGVAARVYRLTVGPPPAAY
ncbi:amidohydrolase family protein [Hamadaea tsunoensis]|uniref:amidohydrolase family protein n=1 Tax=Hamadaea tsunoensis TaxID=53368 RepID=UPI000428FA16|nr:amidohydrolase family protein [Hamadaea tsunoensis]